MDDERLAQLNLGLAHQAAKRWSEAEQVFRDFAERWPQDPRGLQLLGECYRLQGRNEEAIAAARAALACKPDFGPAHFVLGTVLFMANDAAAAEPHLRRAAELLPQNLAVLINYGACLRRLHKEREALPIYHRAAQFAPKDVNLKVNVGLALAGCGDLPAAERWFESALRAEPRNAMLLWGFADAYRLADQPERAVPLYQEALRLNPASGAYRGLAEALLDLGEIEKTEAVLQTAIQRHPAHADTHARLGEVLASLGDLEGAAAAYRAAIRVEPHFHSALGELARLLGKNLPEEERLLVEEALHKPGALNHRAVLHFGLAHAEDARGNHARAAELLIPANAAIKEYRESEGKRYDSAAVDQFLDRAIAAFTPEFFRQTAGFGASSAKPVFVFGMPRSGSTLVEQILASHSRVFGVGEWGLANASWNRLPAALGSTSDPIECLAVLTPDATRDCANWYLDRIEKLSRGTGDRVIDKRLENWLYLGWLATMFPNAGFIHCRRDLRDVALSCWMNNFMSIEWANDLGQIAARIRQYQRGMSHWRAVLPTPILEIEYEQLVQDQEGQSRRLIQWLGLEWEPACLEFHRTRRAVRTASDIQVRRPIYSRSIGRWRHYVDTLRPVIEELGLGME